MSGTTVFLPMFVCVRAQVVGWPPIGSFRKKMAINPPKTDEDADAKLGTGCLYVKVSMDGAPYLRKVDIKIYSSYKDLSSALEKMFSCFTIVNPSYNVFICLIIYQFNLFMI